MSTPPDHGQSHQPAPQAPENPNQGWAQTPPPYQQPFGSPQGQTPPPATNSKAITSLVLGILGIIACPLICSIAAWIVAKQAKEELAANPYQKGQTEAQIGYILGIVGTVIGVLVVLAFVGFFLIAVIAGTTSSEFSTSG